MNYNSEEKKLTLDLSKEKYDPAMLLQHEDVKEIRIEKYNDEIELPTEIHKLETLSILVDDSKKLYSPPANLEHLKNLTLWADFQIEKLAPMPNIESYSANITNTDCIKTIAEKFPNLKRLRLSGSPAPDQTMPSEIGNSPLLESLVLTYLLTNYHIKIIKWDKIEPLQQWPTEKR